MIDGWRLDIKVDEGGCKVSVVEFVR